MSFTVEGDNGTPFTIVSGDTLEFVGQTGIDIGVADPEVRIAMDYNGADSFIMAATNGTSITVDGANDKLVIYDNDASLVKYINANQLPGGGGTTDVYWSGNSDGSISPSGLTTNVGIGTDTPSALFEVKDLIKFPGSNGDLFIGESAGANWESGSQSNTALGKLAMGIGTMNSAVQNTAIGFATLSYITTGDLNTAVGLQASQALDTGTYNTSLGATALFGGTYHSYNTAIGAQAMYFTTNGALGKSVVNDTHNTAVGYHSQYYNLDGAYNTSVGSQSIGSNTIAMAGTGSTAMGYKSLFNNTTGNYNTALGYQAGDNITTGDYNISIGPDADLPSATADYQLNIGNIIYGQDANSDGAISQIGIGTHVPSEILSVSGNTNISDSLLVSGDTYFGSTVDVGVDDTGYDVTFYGDTSGKHFKWDASRDSITLPDDVKIEMGTSSQFIFEHNSTTNLIKLATNPLIISTGSTNPNGNSVLVINTEEQVGIGTQTGNTTNRLHVSGTSGENPVRIQALQTNEGSLVVMDDSGVLYRSERQSNTMSYWSANTDSKSISNSGLTDTKVGVGTHVPDAELTVSAVTGFTTYSYGGEATVSNGQTRLLFAEADQNAGLSVGDTVIFDDSSADSYTMTIATVAEDGVNVTFTASFGGQSGVISNLQVNSQTVGSQFKVYNDNLISTAPSFEVTGGNTFYGGAFSGTGNITTTQNLHISGNTFYEGALSGTGNIITTSDVYSDQIRRATDNSTTTKINLSSSNVIKLFAGNSSNEVMKLESSDVSLPNSTNLIGSANLYISGNTFYEGSISGTSDIQISDAGKLKLGDAGDLEIYHNGTNSFIDDAGTGTIFYRSGTQTFQNAAASKTMAVFNAANSVDLYYNNVQKFETTNTGILVTGDGKGTTLTSTSNLYVTGNTFYEGALSGTGNITTVGGLTVGSDIAMGTNKVTGLGDPTADQDAVTRSYLSSTTAETYSYQYISYFSAVQGANLDGGNWVLPSAGGGISNHTWNNDSGYAGTNDTINSSSFDFPTSDTHIAIPIPVDGFLVGFTCNCRNNGAASEARNAGLFVSNSIPPYGTTSDTPMTLRAFGAGDDLGGSSNSKLYKIDGMLGSGSTVPFAVSKDQVILPAMCAYDTDNIQAQCTWTVVLKTSLSGTT